MPKHKRRLFCEINPFFYTLSLKKEIIKRHIKNLSDKKKFATEKRDDKLSFLISNHSSDMIKRGKGIDITLQKNKAVNIELAAEKINGIIIRPGEIFSFWQTVGSITRRKGYMDGRVIEGGKLKAGIGGGLCNLANTINWMVLRSTLDITEIHKHSDALAPDQGGRIPFSAGTSISYNYVDYRFVNNTNQVFQIAVWCSNERLYAELRSDNDIPYEYKIFEEDHHFKKEGEKFYRISKIYRNTVEKATGKELKNELIWDNHSEVMFDYDLIPKEQIRS